MSSKCEAQAQILDLLQTWGVMLGATVKEEWRIEIEGKRWGGGGGGGGIGSGWYKN